MTAIGISAVALRRRAHRNATEAMAWLAMARGHKAAGRRDATSRCVTVARGLWRIALILRRQARYQEKVYQRQRRKAARKVATCKP